MKQLFHIFSFVIFIIGSLNASIHDSLYDGVLDLKDRTIFVAGGSGMVGTALLRLLQEQGCTKIYSPRHAELDLKNQSAVQAYFEDKRPSVVFLVAANVGGILKNMHYPVGMLVDNLSIELNVFSAAAQYRCDKLVFVGTAAVYPDHIERPIVEEDLLTASLDDTKRPYAIAKIAGIELCNVYRRQYGLNFVAGLPNNIYGPGDNFDPQTGHLMSGLMRRIYDANEKHQSEFVVWGTGRARRELCYVDDVARALIFIAQNIHDKSYVNIGSSIDYSVDEIATTISQHIGSTAEIIHDTTKPDGTMRRLLDSSLLLSRGFEPQVSLQEGIAKTYEWFLAHKL